jgi:uncharacterized membrane protein YphA (DoxX/SURF4 family)
MSHRQELDHSWWTLRLTYGLVPIIAGADKFTHLLVDWTKYLSPAAERVLPFSPSTFMMIVGVVEIVAGLLVLSRWTRLGAYVVSAWLVGIALNLVMTGGYYDIAVRDLVMAIGAFTLARLTELRAHDAADEAAAVAPRGRARPLDEPAVAAR